MLPSDLKYKVFTIQSRSRWPTDLTEEVVSEGSRTDVPQLARNRSPQRTNPTVTRSYLCSDWRGVTGGDCTAWRGVTGGDCTASSFIGFVSTNPDVCEQRTPCGLPVVQPDVWHKIF